MARRNPQTQAKRAREVALRERRERKQEKKAARRAEAGSPEAVEEPGGLQPEERPAPLDDAGASD